MSEATINQISSTNMLKMIQACPVFAAKITVPAVTAKAPQFARGTASAMRVLGNGISQSL